MKKYTMPEVELLHFSDDLLMTSIGQSEFESPKDYASDFDEIETI